MKKNVGDLDAYMRLTAGFTLFGYGIMRKSKWSIFAGSMKIAEGITRWCPMLALSGQSTISEKKEVEESLETFETN